MVSLPIDASPLIISIATTCAATIATFFLGLLAAWWMYSAQVQDGARVWGVWGWGLRALGLKVGQCRLPMGASTPELDTQAQKILAAVGPPATSGAPLA